MYALLATHSLRASRNLSTVAAVSKSSRKSSTSNRDQKTGNLHFPVFLKRHRLHDKNANISRKAGLTDIFMRQDMQEKGKCLLDNL